MCRWRRYRTSYVRRRMGWRVPWFSSNGSRFNEDFAVSITTDRTV